LGEAGGGELSGWTIGDPRLAAATRLYRAFGFEATGERKPARSDPSLELERMEASLVAASGEVGKR
jgi:hypothetical protein